MVRSSLTPWEAQLPAWFEAGPRSFNRFHREMDRLLSDFFGAEEGRETALATFTPQMNVAETDKNYEITVDLPGMKLEDISVELRGDQLVISGERTEEHEEKGKTFHRFERSSGRFARAFPVSTDVKPEQIEAQYKDGVLCVTVPKGKTAESKRISVKS